MGAFLQGKGKCMPGRQELEAFSMIPQLPRTGQEDCLPHVYRDNPAGATTRKEEEEFAPTTSKQPHLQTYNQSSPDP